MKLRSASKSDKIPPLDSSTDCGHVKEKMKLTEKAETVEKTDRKALPGDVSFFGYTANKVVLIVHLNIILYAACFFIQVGTLPYLTRKLNLDSVVFGYLQTTFAVVQLAGGPLFGRFGDLYGGRAALTLAFASSAASYGLLVVSVTPALLFLSRLPSLFMHAMQAGQMVVTDMSDSSGRADALGKLGLSYGIGMIIGPFIGGILTQRLGEVFAAGFACVGSIISLIVCFYFVPSKTKVNVNISQESKSPQSVFSIKLLASLLSQPRAATLLLIKTISGIPIGIFQSMFSVVAMETFKLEPEQNGYIMSFIGCISMITQGIVIGFLLKKTSEINIIKISAFILIWSYLLLVYVQTLVQLYIVLVPMCVGLTLLSVVISSSLTHTVAETDTGAMLGINMAVNSLIRTMSPTVGGYMIASYGFPSIGYLGFVNNSLIVLCMFAWRMK